VAAVDIDGVPFTMTSTGGTNYSKGVTYTYTTSSLSVGDHWYRYRFDDSTDGSDLAIYEGSVKPQITIMSLSHSSVTPTSGSGTAVFTVTDDLDAEYPALAARELGWVYVPLLCAREIAVPRGLARCVRVLLHVNTEMTQEQIRHVYLREAVLLRPTFAVGSEVISASVRSEGESE
jgi:monofunctional chorismate mutase